MPSAMTGAWRPGWLLAAPHRLGFFCAMLVLVAASGWWLAELLHRTTGALGLTAAAVPAVLTHAAVMVFGFMPLFFSGFLFTAGPKWLGVTPLRTPQVAPAVLLQTLGWLLWLAGAYASQWLAAAGLVLALAGLAWMVVLFWRLVAASRAADRVHAQTVGWAGVVGALSLAGVLLAWLAGRLDAALAFTHTGLWGFITVTYVTVAHRMIPFFTANVLPLVKAWRPFWVLWFMVGVALWQVLAAWVQMFWAPAPGGPGAWWLWLTLVLESVAGAVLLWLAVVWGLAQSLRIRLLAMLHAGFTWLGLTLLYSALSRALWMYAGQPVLGLGALHGLGMGFLGSLMLAMVTRVSCGHGGRKLVADNLVWALFWLLQASVGSAPFWVLPLAALLWAGVMTVWSIRYANWYGRPRADGQPG
ncbi:MAG: NnrS family protein [Comamonadaceae bacterium]|nr:NnrS family protein [Comamonadaceae bacterium]